jgi:hypothetical protein
VETVEVDRAREEKKTMLVSKVDWSLFKHATSKGRGAIQGEDTAEGSASALQELAMQACNVSIPWRTRRVKRGNVSWNANLQRMRTETRKAGINMQKKRDQERRVELREVFRRKRAAYKEAIREAKILSLRRTLSRGSPQNPWGFAYRFIASKKRGQATPWTTIQDSEGNWAGNRDGTHPKVLPGRRPGNRHAGEPRNGISERGNNDARMGTVLHETAGREKGRRRREHK